MLRRLEDDLLLFGNRSHSFGRPTTELRETQLQPVSWWEKYGSCAPTLKRLVVRILSQDCSSGPCERNWSTWALFHTKKRNRLSTAQLERLVYCHCNLRLLDHTTSSPKPRQVNVDKIAIEKVKDIPDIPREELDIYTMLYEEMSAPAHQIRGDPGRREVVRVLQQLYSLPLLQVKLQDEDQDSRVKCMANCNCRQGNWNHEDFASTPAVHACYTAMVFM
ncbi:hypothetical protein L7F22_043441 [Adiantum nelumboides]|nr:hypothetical protein [Adiantum nelumboides]